MRDVQNRRDPDCSDKGFPTDAIFTESLGDALEHNDLKGYCARKEQAKVKLLNYLHKVRRESNTT